MRTFGWLEVRLIGELLADHHPDKDPARIGFPELRRLVMELPGFAEEPGHPSNERILEEVQRHWIEEREEGGFEGDGGGGVGGEEDED